MADLINSVTQKALGTELDRASRGLSELPGHSFMMPGLRERDVFIGFVGRD